MLILPVEISECVSLLWLDSLDIVKQVKLDAQKSEEQIFITSNKAGRQPPRACPIIISRIQNST